MNKYPDYLAKIGWQKELGDDHYTFGYIASYKRAGDILVEQIASDLLIYPIMFCYRQYLELLLKNIYYNYIKEKNMLRLPKEISEIGKKNQDKIIESIKNEYKSYIRSVSHNLLKIWKCTRSILKNQIRREKLNYIDEVVSWFYINDPSSDRFRYEYNKRMERNIDNKIFNTNQIKDRMQKIDDILRFTYDN